MTDLGGGDDAKVIADVLGLEEALGEVLEVRLRIVVEGSDNDGHLLRVKLNLVTEVANAAIDLNVLGEVLLELVEKDGLVSTSGLSPHLGGGGAVNAEDLLGGVGVSNSAGHYIWLASPANLSRKGVYSFSIPLSVCTEARFICI